MADNKIKKDLRRFGQIRDVNIELARSLVPVGISFVFLLTVFYIISDISCQINSSTVIILAGILGGYMALNIGANDVANNVGPAVGSKALTMAGALAIAAIFESAGALIAGGNVVSTISKGIINPEEIDNTRSFVVLMFSALLAGALWVNIATWIGAPVSTTHSIVGGVMGSGIAAAGMSVVNWGTMGAIASSWVISPVLGGIIAATLYRFIKAAVLDQKNKLKAAERWVPVLVSIMASAFTMYLMVKGLKRVWKPDPLTIWTVGLLVLVGLPMLLRPFIMNATKKLENRAKSVSTLFTLPLIVSAALLSFAHGANDVANAVGPLAAIVGVHESGGMAAKVGIPIWVMMIGAFGISIGLVLFGPKIVRTVGEQITKLDRIRAFCVALSAAITVIIASGLGLPVSSTHIAVGGVFGIGLYRELSSHNRRKKHYGLELIVRRKLVRRKHLLSIVAAWVVTVPCAALLSGALYYLLTELKFEDTLL